MAFERLDHQRRTAFAVPVFRHRRADPGQRVLGGVVGPVHRVGDSQTKGKAGFGFHRHIGQNVLHQRLLNQSFLERAAVGRVVQRLHQRLPHDAR